MERSRIYREIRRWVEAPCQIPADVDAIESELKRLAGRFKETEDFDPSDGFGEVLMALEELLVSHISTARPSKWARCDVSASHKIKGRIRELSTEDAATELIEAFEEYVIPFECFTILPYEERCRSLRGIMTIIRIHHDQLLACDEHLRLHDELKKKRYRDSKEDYCSEFVENLEADIENVFDWFTRTVDEIATRIEYCLRARIRELKSSRAKPLFLGLLVDPVKHHVSRRGVNHPPIKLTGALWTMFQIVYQKGPKGANVGDVKQAMEAADYSIANRQPTKNRLNKQLEPLGVTVASSEWRLIDT